jgi:hypothetical protein
MTVLQVLCSHCGIGVFVRFQYHGPLVSHPTARNVVPNITNQMRNKSGKSWYGFISGTLELCFPRIENMSNKRRTTPMNTIIRNRNFMI